MEYEKLQAYDKPTQRQPTGVFLCHQMDERVCSGWAGCHDGWHLLALRIAALIGTMTRDDVEATAEYTSPVPLFTTGAEAADHGMAEIANPGSPAVRAITKITRTRRDASSRETD